MKHLTMALALVVCLILGFSDGEAAPDVKVGQLLPLSGHASAPLGQDMLAGTKLAIEHINAEGGIKSLGGAKFNLVTLDTHGDGQNGMTLAERLITVEKVPLIIGAYQSAVTFPATTVAEKYRVPWLVDLAAQAQIMDRGFKYVFRPVQCDSSGMADPTIDFSKWIGDKTGKKAKTIAIVYENTAWGQDLAKTLKTRAPEIGLKIVLDEAYPPGSPNLMPLALKIKGANADIISLTSYTADAILIGQLLARQQIDAMAVIGSAGGYVDGTFVPSVGVKETAYIYSVDPWGGYEACVKTPWARKVWDDFKKANGREMTVLSAFAYAVARVAAEGVERAKSQEPEAIRNALAKLSLKKGDLVDFVGFPIEFNNKGQNPHVRYVMKQIYNGKYNVVWPPNLASTEFKPAWPVPKWADRK